MSPREAAEAAAKEMYRSEIRAAGAAVQAAHRTANQIFDDACYAAQAAYGEALAEIEKEFADGH